MGLDTTSYSKIEAMPEDWEPPFTKDGGVDYEFLWDEGISRAYTYDSFPRAMDGIEGGHEPDPLHSGMLGSRWYKMHDPGPCTRSSYSGHTVFRRALMNAFWPLGRLPRSPHVLAEDYDKNLPFIDLIYFADNEGILGPEACARLVKDFEEYPEYGYEYPYRAAELFEDWKAAVNHAAGEGCIDFH